jgi:hypothetical protein
MFLCVESDWDNLGFAMRQKLQSTRHELLEIVFLSPRFGIDVAELFRGYVSGT